MQQHLHIDYGGDDMINLSDSHLFYIIENRIANDKYGGLSHVAEHALLIPTDIGKSFKAKGYTCINHVFLSFSSPELTILQEIDSLIMSGRIITEENVRIAKEQVISSMSIIAGLSENVSTYNELFGAKSVFAFFNPISAYAFIVFNLFSAPCFSAIIAMGKELKSFKSMLKAIVFQILTAWVISSAIYKIGSLLFY